ncbi:MAG TPA: TolC family protein [Niabella sp.]|nr:TolC family protein [Niabella sp.]HOZ95826.1 TolC family protein [Niabella sp.]HQW13680.1 TolC family protein [Niabella sp.]HQX19074.1 TolC family protein [Niabella sp.]HQX42373.1 TolC family protein [Niabella sp.]
MMNRIILLLGCGLFAFSYANAQSITLEACYRLAKANYPAIKKMDLISQSVDYTIWNANKKFLPQFNIAGQATYQSQVVDYSELLGGFLPTGFSFPEFSKDQYRISGEVEQLLFDGGNTRNQNEITKANAGLQKQNVEVDLYAINDRINTIFFSIFLMDAQLEINNLKIANLQTQLDKTESAYKYGTAYASDVNEIKAEIENTKSTNIDYMGNRSAFLKMLSIFIGKEVASSSDLVKPESIFASGEINRPELKMFDLQKNIFETQSKQLKSSYLPTFKAFFQGAYGRPTFNPISNDFGAWYITGIRLNWSLGSLYTLKNQRAIYNLNSLNAETDKETFIRNVQMDIAQQNENVKKYTEMIGQDNKTIALREEVTQSASAQLANGVITTHEYIQKVNNENAAKQNLILHQIQLLQAQYNLKFKSGN